MKTPEQTPLVDNPFHTWGLWAVALGALSLIIVFIQIFAPMSQPQPSVGTQVGEIAGDMTRSAWRSFFGLEADVAEPEPVSMTVYLVYIAPIMGVVAVVLSMVSGIRGENWRFAAYGTGLGGAAVLFHFFWWVAMLVCGVMLLIAIIENFGGLFPFGLWD